MLLSIIFLPFDVILLDVNTVAELSTKFHAMWPILDERRRRLIAAIEAKSLGYGGVSLVSRACGLSRNSILKGIREIEAETTSLEGRIRRPGAGRKPISVSDPTLEGELEAILEETTRGDPQVSAALDSEEHT